LLTLEKKRLPKARKDAKREKSNGVETEEKHCIPKKGEGEVEEW